MFGITDLTTFLVGTILIILLPGPNSLYVMSIASRHGIKAGYWGAFGIFCGDSILMILTVLGAATLLHNVPWIFIALKAVGALYLSYIGIRLILAGKATWLNPPQKIEEKLENNQRLHPFRNALMISLINPKAILFFLSFFLQFVDPNYPQPAISFTLLAIMLQIISMTYLSALIFSGIKISSYFNRRYKLSAAAIATVGTLFCLFGIRLALSSI